jgi:hypothetical protein
LPPALARAWARRRAAHRWLEGPWHQAQQAVGLRLPELVVEEGEAVAKQLPLSMQARAPVQTEAAVRTEMEAGEARSLADWIHRKEEYADYFRVELE